MPRPLSKEEIVEIAKETASSIIKEELVKRNLLHLYDDLSHEHNLSRRTHRKNLAQYVAWENILDVPKECFRCYLGADQENIADDTSTTLQFSNAYINYDSEGKGLAGYGYIVSVAGIYRAFLNVYWKNCIADKIYGASIFRNSTRMGQDIAHTSAGTAHVINQVYDEFHCNVGDVIYGKVKHISGAATPDVNGGSRDETYMVIRRVRPKLITEEL